MNGKHYIGNNAVSFQSTGRTQTIDGVVLVVDEGTEYHAGDLSGYVLELECPYGTQNMADALMEKLRGQSYDGFETEGAKLPMEAELGDGVTVKGLYGPLVRRRVQFVGDLASDISAPVGGDTDHEFGYTDPTRRAIERKAAQTRSYIDKQADAIKIGVENDLGGQISEIDVKVGEITATVQEQGEAMSTLKQTADGLTASVSALSDDVGEVSGELSMKVGRDENDQIVSMLNASADVINIKGNRLTIDSTNFKVAADGTVTCTGGAFGGFEIGTDMLGMNLTNGPVTLDLTGIEVETADHKTYTLIRKDEVVTTGRFVGKLDGPAVYELWRNGAPSSSFSAQTLTIPGLSDYNVIIVVQNYSTGSPAYTSAGIYWDRAGTSLAINCGTSNAGSGDGHVSSQRVYGFASKASNRMTVSEGRRLNYSGTTEGDTYGIPLAVLGVKGDLYGNLS